MPFWSLLLRIRSLQANGVQSGAERLLRGIRDGVRASEATHRREINKNASGDKSEGVNATNRNNRHTTVGNPSVFILPRLFGDG